MLYMSPHRPAPPTPIPSPAVTRELMCSGMNHTDSISNRSDCYRYNTDEGSSGGREGEGDKEEEWKGERAERCLPLPFYLSLEGGREAERGEVDQLR